MEQQTVEIGEQHYDSSTGFPTKSTYRDVKFQGEKLHTRNASSEQNSGTDKVLFKLHEDEIPEDAGEEEQYLVHLHSWSCWQGTTETKRLAGPMDARALTDDHPQLAKGAKVDVPASLDEVL